MTKQAKILIVVLTVLGSLLGYNVWFFSKSKNPPPAKTAEKRPSRSRAAAAPPSTSARIVPAVQVVSFPSVHSSWGRNPFLLPMEEAAGKPYDQLELPVEEEAPKPDLLEYQAALEKYRLVGVVDDGESPLAIINQQLFRVGDLLESKFEIREILHDRIVVEADGNTFQLSLRSVTEPEQRD
jgi:hypothetical protein